MTLSQGGHLAQCVDWGSGSAQFVSALDALPSWSLVLDAAASPFYVAAAYCVLLKEVSSFLASPGGHRSELCCMRGRGDVRS
jgi:hypothetical protein